MGLQEHDNRVIYCRMLGHQVPFSYCRQGASGQPCRRIFDCWFQTFDIETFIQAHFTQSHIEAFLTPAKPKLTTLLELIQQAKKTGQNADTEG